MSVLSAAKNPTILVAVLNWGLGHAIRCIPVIRSLSAKGCCVVLASDGDALSVLRQNFPELPALELPAYRIRYPFASMYLNIAIQGPKIGKTICAEYQWVQKTVSTYGINGILSDARFGCFSPHIPSIFITHQVQLPIPDPFFRYMGNAAQKKLFRQYSELWIPDLPAPDCLGGKLSEATGIPNARYIGILSDQKAIPVGKKTDIDVLAVLSGPEPQRSRFEQRIIQQISGTGIRVTLVRGVPGTVSSEIPSSENLEVLPFLGRAELNQYLSRSNVLLSRSGYTTLMDLAYWRKKAILVPTPGQTEQEYLAQLHHDRGHFFATAQKKFQIAEAIHQVQQSFAGIPAHSYKHESSELLLEQAVQAFLNRL